MKKSHVVWMASLLLFPAGRILGQTTTHSFSSSQVLPAPTAVPAPIPTQPLFPGFTPAAGMPLPHQHHRRVKRPQAQPTPLPQNTATGEMKKGQSLP